MASILLKPKIKIDGKRYSVLNSIAEGACAYVYRVKSVNMADFNSHYAVKKMFCQTPEQIADARKEISLLESISHSNVISLIAKDIVDGKRDQVTVFMLLPLFTNSVQGFIDKCQGYPHSAFSDPSVIIKVLANVADGLGAIHNLGYRHCDIKPANILLTKDMVGVITDLGSASPLRTECHCRRDALALQEEAAQFSTASYRSPELMDPPNNCVIDGKADVWALGCTFYAMCFSRTPFEGKEGLSTLSLVSGTVNFPSPHPFRVDWLEVMRLCLLVDQSRRLDVSAFIDRLQQLSQASSRSAAPTVGPESDFANFEEAVFAQDYVSVPRENAPLPVHDTENDLAQEDEEQFGDFVFVGSGAKEAV